MTLFYVSIGTKEYKVEISNRISKINGEAIQAALVELGERGLYLLKKGAQKRELLIQSLGNNQYSLNVNGKHAVVKVEKSKGNSRHKTNPAAVGDMKAPIAGVVVKVNVSVGDQVKKNDVVLILESMKMQMLMRATVSGTVDEVYVAPGSQLSKGDRMVRIV